MNDKLNSTWVLWYHDTNDKNWDLKSYKNIYEFNDIDSFWKMINTIEKYYKNYNNDMLFIMRKNKNEYIYPMWEDKHNTNGGYWSFKIEKNNLNDIWIHTIILLISEQLINKKSNDLLINGISISPKKNNCILKIWNNNHKINDKKILTKIKNINYNEILYKSHNDNIKQDNNKLNNNKLHYFGRRHNVRSVQ